MLTTNSTCRSLSCAPLVLELCLGQHRGRAFLCRKAGTSELSCPRGCRVPWPSSEMCSPSACLGFSFWIPAKPLPDRGKRAEGKVTYPHNPLPSHSPPNKSPCQKSKSHRAWSQQGVPLRARLLSPSPLSLPLAYTHHCKMSSSYHYSLMTFPSTSLEVLMSPLTATRNGSSIYHECSSASFFSYRSFRSS